MGFAATIDGKFTVYYTEVLVQDKQNQEIICSGLKVIVAVYQVVSFQDIVIRALSRYHEVNKSLPQQILLYRDGVGDGMLSEVLKSELSQFDSAFSSFAPVTQQFVLFNCTKYQPKFTAVVVKKRTNTRLFLANQAEINNPLPGAIADKAITHKGWYDFYLVSTTSQCKFFILFIYLTLSLCVSHSLPCDTRWNSAGS